MREAVLKLVVSIALVAIPLVSACNLSTNPSIVCTSIFVYGVSVSVVDSATGAPGGIGATLIVTDGAYADTASSPPGAADETPLSGAGERAGTYLLRVLKKGYEPWTKSAVQVTKNACHVIPVAMTAELQPLP